MPNPTWPAELPAPLNESGQFAPLVDNVIATQMETGAPKRRRRFTAVPEAYSGTVLLTGAQTETLRTFVATTLQDVLPFDWTDWRNGSTATYVFQRRPTFSRVQGAADRWKASIELMKVP
jgi:hypothetical protein